MRSVELQLGALVQDSLDIGRRFIARLYPNEQSMLSSCSI